MIDRLRNRSRLARTLVYAIIAILAFAFAAGVGAIGALVLRGDLALPGGIEPGASQERAETSQHQGTTERAPQSGPARKSEPAGQAEPSQQQDDENSRQEKPVPQQSEVEYISKVGDIQNRSVDTFLDIHAKLRHYDALTAQDIEELRADQAALQGLAEEIDETDPPQGYTEQYEALRSAVNHLHEASQLAYGLAVDPVAATQSKFDEYDRHVEEAEARLQESNEILGREYKSFEGIQKATSS